MWVPQSLWDCWSCLPPQDLGLGLEGALLSAQWWQILEMPVCSAAVPQTQLCGSASPPACAWTQLSALGWPAGWRVPQDCHTAGASMVQSGPSPQCLELAGIPGHKCSSDHHQWLIWDCCEPCRSSVDTPAYSPCSGRWFLLAEIPHGSDCRQSAEGYLQHTNHTIFFNTIWWNQILWKSELPNKITMFTGDTSIKPLVCQHGQWKAESDTGKVAKNCDSVIGCEKSCDIYQLWYSSTVPKKLIILLNMPPTCKHCERHGLW